MMRARWLGLIFGRVRSDRRGRPVSVRGALYPAYRLHRAHRTVSWPFLVMIKPPMQPHGHGLRIVMVGGPGVSPPPAELPFESSDTVTSVLPSFSDVGQGKIEAAPLARGRFTFSGRATMPPLTSVGSTVTTSTHV